MATFTAPSTEEDYSGFPGLVSPVPITSYNPLAMEADTELDGVATNRAVEMVAEQRNVTVDYIEQKVCETPFHWALRTVDSTKEGVEIVEAIINTLQTHFNRGHAPLDDVWWLLRAYLDPKSDYCGEEDIRFVKRHKREFEMLWVIEAVEGHIHPEVADLLFPDSGLERVYRTVPMLFGAERTEEMDE